MRNLMIVLSALAVMALAFWAYRENYRTQAELAEVHDLQYDIGRLRESLGVLRAEWAYLNRPDRLRELADINFARLGLLPLEPRQFGDVGTLAYPAVALPPITEPVDTIALGETTE
ncbi:hypothetical protein DEA8626_02267 [Defluviimonas aquaemixtae]|uniref:Cell division protein FtsL n=1 Tax=Albidovulum aquaemixtae TaxID=1542388 RepID=A0A2R8B7U7_9RHOB|nr:cell division protein FtsL [Defluviimonas aquaemixtae]SPH18725.1 hypothetical protein DEA8626_02267 [Defluviimonas aquaemixtae]